MSLKVLSVVSEAYPLVKTGGLGDVAGALPSALAPHGVEVTTFLPGYPSVMKALRDAVVLHSYDSLFGEKAQILSGWAGKLKLIVLDLPGFYDRPGGPYCDASGKDWDDNWRRFGAFSRAAADVAQGKFNMPSFDVLHAHDWQAAMAPAYLHYDGAHVPSIMTVHNIAFAGWFPNDIFVWLGLPWHAYSMHGVEYYGGVGFLKAGLFCADAITTVSPTYAEEIGDAHFGMGLEGLVRARRDRVYGIVNGIDTEVWNPAEDPHLLAQYERLTLNRRLQNRLQVEKAFDLDGGTGPIFCVVSRLTTQKGMDVLAGMAENIVTMGGRLALIGTGEHYIENAFMDAAKRFKGRIGVKIGYDEELSHLLQGGSDAILVPSRFEPCGLTQLYGLRYGCVPIAAHTGGLADTIIDANEAALSAGVATGFLFDEVNHDTLSRVLSHAIYRYQDRPTWKALQEQGMRMDFSWRRSGQRYAELYRRFAKKNAPELAEEPAPEEPLQEAVSG
ncbi:starch synthase [Rhizomicrobium palustre]|uniref:Glycogen synthase n=1 Tax=Rhizomicrobium palustre TaxID=189966 RepID=A0A846N134_9PROT|nr:glycogen synthase GlgA [Rhizomicrobium palustre]NIK89674.1 starch synthase [Rhizomicrobium palustre]